MAAPVIALSTWCAMHTHASYYLQHCAQDILEKLYVGTGCLHLVQQKHKFMGEADVKARYV